MSGSLNSADAILAQAGLSSSDQAQATPEPTDHFAPELLRQRVLTLGDAIDVLPELDDVPEVRKAGWLASARFFAKRLGVSCHDVRLDPVEMHERLRSCFITPARKLGAKRQSNVRSELNGIATRMGWVMAYGGPNAHPLRDQRWIQLIEALTYSPQRSVVAGFARYCELLGSAPHDVTPDALEGYADWRRANTYDTSIIKTASAIRKLWNRSAQTIPGWPHMQFPTPGHHKQFRADLSEFPDSLVREIEAYGRDLLNPDPMEDHARKALAETTAKMWRDALLWSVTALREDGRELAALTSLSCVVTPDNLHAVLKVRLSRSGGKWSSMARTIKSAFLDVAKRKLCLSPEQMSRLEATAAKVKSPTGRLSQKRTDDTLAITSDPKLVEAFMKLPWTIAESAEKLRQTMLELSLVGPWWDQNQDWKWLRRLPGVPSLREARASRREPRTFDPARLSGAINMEVDGLRGRELSRDDQLWARDLAIMCVGLHATLRPRNLHGCRLGETVHVQGSSVRLVFPEEETKTKRPILTELPPQAAAVVRFYIDHIRPSLRTGCSEHSALWVTFFGSPLGQAQTADACRRVGMRLIGQSTNPNSTRHSFATWMRTSSPTNLQVVATGLGHATTRTMLRSYDRSGDLPACESWKKLKRRIGKLK